MSGQSQSVFSFLSTYNGPAYVRLSGVAPCTPVYSELPSFNLTSFDDLLPGSDALILSYGSILSECIQANNILNFHSLSVRIINVPSVHTLSSDLLDIVCQYRHVFVVEEHRLTGGLFTLLSQALHLSTYNNLPSLVSISLPDLFLKSGSYSDLLSYYKLDSSSIADTIIKSIT